MSSEFEQTRGSNMWKVKLKGTAEEISLNSVTHNLPFSVGFRSCQVWLTRKFRFPSKFCAL